MIIDEGNTNSPVDVGAEQAPPVSEKRPENKNKRTPFLIAVVLAVVAVIVVGVVVLINVLNSKEEPGIEDQTVYYPNYMEVDEGSYKALDLEDDVDRYYGDFENAIDYMLMQAGVFEGCEAAENRGLCTVDKFNAVVAEQGITEPRHLELLEIRKSIIYIDYGEMELAWGILGPIIEDDLLYNELHLYYTAMWNYYRRLGDEEKIQHYAEEIDSVFRYGYGGENNE